MIDAARSLGLTPWQTWWQVNVPLARPAIAAGALLALMETLADYGASVYFGLQTFTAAIYRAWFSLGDRMAASQLAAVLLVIVLPSLPRTAARGRVRFFTPTAVSGRRRRHLARMADRQAKRRSPRARFRAARLCHSGDPFAAPAGAGVEQLDWPRYLQRMFNTVAMQLSVARPSSCDRAGLAYAARAAERIARPSGTRVGALMSLDALPGAVIAVGILVPLANFDNALDGVMRSWIGGHRAAADGQRVCAALRLPRALFRGRLPVGRGRTFPHHADDGCQRAQPR
jgi:iron(III) transport system permease protein